MIRNHWRRCWLQNVRLVAFAQGARCLTPAHGMERLQVHGRVSVTITTVGQCPPTVSTFTKVHQQLTTTLLEKCAVSVHDRQLNVSTMLGSVFFRKQKLYPHQPRLGLRLPSRNMQSMLLIFFTRRCICVGSGKLFPTATHTSSVACRVEVNN